MNVAGLLLVCCWLVGQTAANLNLFLSQGEVKRLLGLDNELYYVRDGTVNQYAIGFVIPIPSWVDVLHFTWFLSSALLPLNYKLTLSSSDPDIIGVPSVNISTSGSIPTHPQVWGVTLGCTGQKGGDVVITIDLILNQLDINKLTNTTLLSFKRKKVCHTFDVEATASPPSNHVPAHVLFFSSVGGCLLFLVILLVLVITTWMRRSGSKSKYSSVTVNEHNLTQQTSVSQTVLNRSGADSHINHAQASALQTHTNPLNEANNFFEQQHFMLNNSHQGVYPLQSSPRLGYGMEGAVGGAALGVLKQAPNIKHEDMLTSDVDARYHEKRTRSSAPLVPIEEIAVDRLSLTLGDLLHEGTFGRIYQGRLDIDCDSEDVMVKTVVMGSSPHQTDKLVREGSQLYGINQKHVLALAATTYDGSSPMMIYPYSYPGNLKRWLQTSHQNVSTHQAVCLGLQLLTALKHLHKRHIIHKDVSARNCFLSMPLTVKICDAALSRDIFPNDYHCLGDNENRPVKWMGVECISGEEEFTTASDVWSWGVTIWEILTRAQQPFPDVDPFEMEAYLREGFRLHQPTNCPDQLYTVMASCWAHSPSHRTSVPNLYSHLNKFSSQLQEFV